MDLKTIMQRAKAFDYLFDAVVVTNMEGTIVDWNKGSQKLYGYTKSEAIGQAVSMLHAPEDIERITAEVISAVTLSGKWTGEIQMLHKDGHVGWIESMCVPIFDESEQMIGALGVNRDITSRIEKIERLNHLAYYDNLTEIPNRSLLLDRISHLIKQSKRNSTTFALLYIDLDHFKSFNDTRGHALGDVILKEVAIRMTGYLRKSDTFARIGGDEFILLLENTSNKEEITRLKKAINQLMTKPFVFNNETFNISCSIGVSIFPDDGQTVDALLDYADKAMYTEKKKSN